MNELLKQIRQCNICENDLPLGAKPVLSASPKSKILIVGQAPGIRVHESGIPWNDQSGKNLRKWLGVTNEEFYDVDNFGIVPMGFCYPGTGASGDLPPRKECAPAWHPALLAKMKNVQFTLLIGMYAQRYYLKSPSKTLTENVRNFEDHLPTVLPLPHPSPRNRRWLTKNPWYQLDLIPILQARVQEVLRSS